MVFKGCRDENRSLVKDVCCLTVNLIIPRADVVIGKSLGNRELNILLLLENGTDTVECILKQRTIQWLMCHVCSRRRVHCVFKPFCYRDLVRVWAVAIFECET